MRFRQEGKGTNEAGDIFVLFAAGYSAYQALGNGHKGNGGKPFGKSNGVGAYDSVQGPFIKGLFQLRYRCHMVGQTDLRKRFLKVREEIKAPVFLGCQAQTAEGFWGGKRRKKGLIVSMNFFHAFIKLPSFLCKRKSAPGTKEKDAARFLLQLGNVLAHGGLGNVAPIGGFCKTFGFCRRKEIVKFINIHRSLPA